MNIVSKNEQWFIRKDWAELDNGFLKLDNAAFSYLLIFYLIKYLKTK